MIFQDDRTPEQRKQPHIIVLATDRFMSGWGGAKGGPSYAGWACAPSAEYDVYRRIAARGEMRRVRVVGSNYRPKGGAGHCHIYVDDSLKSS